MHVPGKTNVTPNALSASRAGMGCNEGRCSVDAASVPSLPENPASRAPTCVAAERGGLSAGPRGGFRCLRAAARVSYTVEVHPSGRVRLHSVRGDNSATEPLRAGVC